MRALSPDHHRVAYQNQTVDIKIASNPGSVMSLHRKSIMNDKQPLNTFDEPSEVDTNTMNFLSITISLIDRRMDSW